MARMTFSNRWKAFWMFSRWRSFIVTLFVFLLMLTAVLVTWRLDRQDEVNIDHAAGDAIYFGTTLAPGQTGVAVYGIRPVVDFSSATVAITWMPYACGSLTLEGTGCSRRFTKAVDFFIDNAVNATYTLDPAWIPRMPDDASDYVQLQPSWTFPYTHNFRAGTWDSHLDLTYYYPSDSLNSTTVFRAADTATGQAIPVLQVAIPESPTGYKVSGWDFDVVFNATSNTRVTGRWMGFTFYRTTTVKAFASIILVANWGLTLVVLHITVYYVMEGNRVEVPSEILLLPVSVILTVPQLRDAMPDVPRFGIMIDILGYFFNLIIIALCSFILILLLIYQRKRLDTAPSSPLRPPRPLSMGDPGYLVTGSPQLSNGYKRQSTMDAFDDYMRQNTGDEAGHNRPPSMEGSAFSASPFRRQATTDSNYQRHLRQGTMDALIERRKDSFA